MLGIIGGSGFYQAGFLHNRVEQAGCSQYGEASERLVFGNISEGAETRADEDPLQQHFDACFLARHGRHHSIPPHRINYRANIDVMVAAGVQRIIAVNAVGSCRPDIVPGSLVVPDQLIDYSYGREHTFFDELNNYGQHIDFTQPFDGALRSELLATAKACGIAVIDGSTYGCTQGPRLESAAEIHRLRNDGCDLVGMTAMPEAALAREKQLPYAMLCVVVNLAAGVEGDSVNTDDMAGIMEEAMEKVRGVVVALIGGA